MTKKSIAWERSISTNVPAAAGISMANAVSGAPGHPSVALVTFSSDDALYQYRAIAVDPVSGEQRWSTDLGAACETSQSDYSLVVPLASGDIAVAASVSPDWQPASTCVRKLRGSDGEVLWSRLLDAPGESLTTYSLIEDGDGHLLLAGQQGRHARVLRLDAQAGATLWTQTIPADTGTSRAIASASGANDSSVIHILDQSGDARSMRLVGIHTSTGVQRWDLSYCTGAFVANQRSSNEIRLRMLADTSVTYVSSCQSGSERGVELGRLNAQTGAAIWQRTLAQSKLYQAVIDDDGNPVLDGSLLIGATEAGIARLDASNGSLQWSLPRPAVAPGYPPYVSNRLVMAGSYLHVLELNVAFPDYIDSATVATYAASTGEFLSRHDAGLPQQELIVPSSVTMHAFGNGEMMIGALSGQNRYVGSRLFETRLSGLTGQAAWTRQTPVMAMHRLAPLINRSSTGRQMIWNGRGGPGVVLAGRGINPEGYDYPRALKVSALDGRVLWRWEPDKRVDGNVAAAITTSQGDLIIAGSNGWDDPPLLLARLDGGTGQPAWEASVAADRVALDATLDPSGNIALLQDAAEGDPDPTLQVSRRSASDGAQLWATAIPESWSLEMDQHRIATDAQGAVLALSGFQGASGEYGMQVARFRMANGALDWRRKLPGLSWPEAASMQILADGSVIVATREHIWRLNGATGEVAWQKAAPVSAKNLAVGGQGHILVGGSLSNRRAVARLNATTGCHRQRWRRQPGRCDDRARRWRDPLAGREEWRHRYRWQHPNGG